MQIEKTNLDDTDYWIGMQLNCGKVRSYFTQPTNQISTRKYSVYHTIIGLMQHFLGSFQSLSLIATIITIISLPNIIPYGIELYSTQLIIFLLVLIAKEIYFDNMKGNLDNSTNNSTTTVFRNGKEIAEMPWKQVRQGDIVYLTHGEIAPADILLLDSQQIQHRQAMTHVDTINVNSSITPQRKKSSYLTQLVNRGVLQKRIWSHYSKIITGKINYEKPNRNLNEFKGYLKLSKDPKVQKLSIQNLILRNSRIKTSLWVYGLVLYTGMDCKIMLNSAGKQKINWGCKVYLFSVCILINIILGLSFGLAYILKDQNHKLWAISVYHFLMFSIFLPQTYQIAKSIFILVFSFARKFKNTLICNYESLFNLGNIDFAVLSTTGVISSGEVIINQIITSSSVYEIKGDQQTSQRKSRLSQRRHASSARSNLSGFKLPYMTINNDLIVYNDQKQDEKFEIDDNNDTQGRLNLVPPSPSQTGQMPKIKKNLQPLKIDKKTLYNYIKHSEKQSIEIIKSFVLCHNARLFYNPQKQAYHGISSIKYEQILLKLASNVGWDILPKFNGTKELGLIVKQEKTTVNQHGGIKFDYSNTFYEWVGINNFLKQRDLFSVVVTFNDKCVLYCKGKPQHMVSRLKMTKETQKSVDNIIQNYQQEQNTILYAKRQFSYEQRQQYENQYSSLKLSLTTTQEQIEQFSKKYEKNLEFICIVSFNTQINQHAQQLIHFLYDCCIKVCMLAKNRSEISIFKSFLAHEQQIEYIYLQNQSSQLLRYYLNYVTSRFKKESFKKYALIINSKSYQIMQLYEDIMQHFIFALYRSEGLLTLGFSPEVASDLTNRLKNSYPRQHRLLGVGHSYCDMKFLANTDISIGLNSNIPADIRVESLDRVIQILELGPYFSESLSAIINLSVYRSLRLLMVLLVYELILIINNSSFTINQALIFIYLIPFNMLQIGYIIYLNRKTTKVIKPAYYANFKRMKQRIIITSLQGLIHGFIIVGSVVLTLPQVRLQGGKLLTIQAEHFSIFILLILVSKLRYLFNQKIKICGLLIITLVSAVVVILSLILASIIDPNFAIISLQFVKLFSNYDSIILIINTTIFCTAITSFLKMIQKRFLPQIFDKFDPSTSNEIIRFEVLQNPQITNVEIVKHLWKDQENMDSSVAQLVSDEIDVNVLKINKFWEINNKESNIKYLYENREKNIKVFAIICITFILIWIYMLIDELVRYKSFHSSLIPIIIGIIMFPLVVFYMLRAQQFMNYYYLVEIVLGLSIIITILYTNLFQTNHYEPYLLYSVMVLLITEMMQIRLVTLSIFCICLAVANTITVALNLAQYDKLNIFIQTIAVIVLLSVSIFSLWRTTIQSKTNFIINENFQKQTNQVNDVLSILVPKFVKNHLENNIQNMSLEQEQNKVAILFCYVCNFDEIVKQQGKNVVILMDELFRQFDQLCPSFAVQKIETVGMTYMAATGIKDYEAELENEMTKKNQVQRLLKMSIQMIDKATSITWGQKKNKRLKIKIGIHAGDVIVGVIGFHKPQFSLIGDTVNTTSRHCSTASVNQIVLSEIAFKMIKRFPHSSFKQAQKQMKGLGVVNIYRYLRNQSLQTRHMKIRLKFISIVKKVIQKLRQQGKIKYKKFKASDLIENAMEYQRASTKKLTQRRRSSVQLLQYQLDELREKKIQRNAQFELKHNHLLQLSQNYPNYHSYMNKKFSYGDKILLILLIVIYSIITIINISTQFYSPPSLVLKLIAIALYILTVAFQRKAVHNKIIKILFLLIHLFATAVNSFQYLMIVNQSPFENIEIFYNMLTITILSIMSSFRFVQILCISIVLLGFNIANKIVLNYSLTIIVFELFYFVIILIRKYNTLKDSYKNYTHILTFQKRSQQQSGLVSQLLPKHAYEKLKNQNIENRLQLTDKFQHATMLFADIKGFTSFSNRSTPAGVVKMLKELFEQFDKNCLKYNVYKVYTIGDCYVVLGFTDCYKRNILQQAKNVVNMGLSMVQIIQKVRQTLNFPQLDMRIGIHTGTIIGGIIGTEIVRYDIYGPDVMIANKFEQYGKTGHIHISQATKQILDQDKKKTFNIVPNGTVKIEKLNVELNGYILTRKKFEL